METNEKTELLSLTRDELYALVRSISPSEPQYRIDQLYSQLHKGISPEQMTNIPKRLKEALAQVSFCALPQIHTKLVSAVDGTVKYLFRLYDGNCIESVVMKYKHGNTICISSQVGCRMGCKFCASTIGGRVRDLLCGEMLGQILVAQKDTGERISNVVMMGIGEPLDNFDNTVRFLHTVNDPQGLGIGYRHISLSTCGIVPKIYELAQLNLPITLSISLHAPDDEARSEIMPINKKYPIDELMDACFAYYAENLRRISFEYTLIAGKNDSVERARSLARLLNSSLRRGGATMPIHVNLIPVNDVTESGFKRSAKAAIDKFAATLESQGIRATVRRRLGPDINASCGQLRRQSATSDGESKKILDGAE